MFYCAKYRGTDRNKNLSGPLFAFFTELSVWSMNRLQGNNPNICYEFTVT